MGFKAIEVFPLSPTGPTVLIPTGKEEQLKLASAARTDTAAKLAFVLPADASIMSIFVFSSTASDAATTAILTFTASNNTGTISTGTYDVKANGGTSGAVQMSNLPNLENIPLQGDIRITVTYSETGTASTTGGPWKFSVRYIR